MNDRRSSLRSPNNRPDSSADVHSNIGAYVVDALDAPEQAEFRAHLGSCDSCRREVVEFSETTAQLAGLEQVPPPAELRRSTLAAIRKIRPLPPPEQPAPQSASVPDEVAPLDEHPSVMPWSLALGAVPTETPANRQVRVNRVLLAVAIAALLLCLVLGGWVFVLLQ